MQEISFVQRSLWTAVMLIALYLILYGSVYLVPQGPEGVEGAIVVGIILTAILAVLSLWWPLRWFVILCIVVVVCLAVHREGHVAGKHLLFLTGAFMAIVSAPHVFLGIKGTTAYQQEIFWGMPLIGLTLSAVAYAAHSQLWFVAGLVALGWFGQLITGWVLEDRKSQIPGTAPV